MPLELTVRQVALGRTPCRTRLPFRFGSATVTAADLLTCRVTCADPKETAVDGWSADLLVPRWFRKDNEATPADDADELYRAAVAAALACTARASAALTPFALWHEVFDERVVSQPVDAPDLLVHAFGCSLLERAMIDAACRRARMPFHTALRADVFGFQPGEVLGELDRWDWQQALPAPRPRLTVRHTIGMLDVLRTSHGARDRADDGLPRSLEQDIEAYGLSWFKVKIGAGHAKDRARLIELAAFFAERDLSPGLTLDGNEQFADLATLADLLEAVAAEPSGRELLRRVAWIEQPLPRAATFSAARHRDLVRVLAFAPLSLDEADALPGSFRDALELGYRGVSVKNCKGVFRALCNFGLCQLGDDRFQSGEDLTNIAVLPLQQDLVTAAVLGLSHVERNGHHYFRGLDHLPPQFAAQAMQAHPDLYRPLGCGAALRIEGGEVEFATALAAKGYGHALEGHAPGMQVVASS